MRLSKPVIVDPPPLLPSTVAPSGGCWMGCGSGAPCSLSIRGLNDETNDVYVLQPYALYNDRPFYIGAGRGQYLYFYEPTSHALSLIGNPNPVPTLWGMASCERVV